MLYQQYYFIEGNDNLLNNTDIEDEFRKVLAEPVILANDEGGKTFWKEEDYEISVKIMFLIFLKKNLDHSFINQSPISIDFFDQWWRVKRADTPIYSREILQNVEYSILEKIQLTGKELPDSFICRLKKS